MSTTRKDLPLNAVTLKQELWDTLKSVKDGYVTPATGDVVASQAREILRTVRTQLQVFSQSGAPVSKEVVTFANAAGEA